MDYLPLTDYINPFASVFSTRKEANASEVQAEEVIKHWSKPIKLVENYVTLVGGTCNFENGTRGDIDVLLRKAEPAGDEDTPLLFRLYRALPDNLRERLHFVYDLFHGPFTPHRHVYDLWLVPSHKSLDLMSLDSSQGAEAAISKKEDKVLPGRFFKMLKPMHGRLKGEEYSVQGLIDVVDSRKPDWYETGIYVETKYDGVHCQLHKWDDQVKIFTEEGTDVTGKLPTLRDALSKQKGTFVRCAELELWKDNLHQPRQLTAAIFHTKGVHEDEPFMVANVFDELFWEGEDRHKEPFEDRRKALESRSWKGPLKIGKSTRVSSQEALTKAVREASDQPGSEGAYLKLASFPYELDGQTLSNIKFKTTAQLDVEVLSVHSVLTAKSFNYLCVIRNEKGQQIPVGNTYNTSIKASPGDILTVEFVDINRYTDPSGRVWYNFWSPRVLRKRSDKNRPDSTGTADKLVKATGGQDIKKKWPTRYAALDSLDWGTQSNREVFPFNVSPYFGPQSLREDANPYLVLPDEDKKWKGMCHAHIRGKSVHLDLRLQNTSDAATGWTLFIPKGLSKTPDSISEAKQLYDSEIAPLVKATLEDPLKKFNCGTKLPEPVEWLTYSGKVEPGQVGATAHEPGYFLIVDSFEVQFGTQKSYFHEYFCNGKLFSGRVVTRLLENRKEWKKTDEGLMTWMCWVAKEETPYVLSPRAVKKGWIPPQEHSALPRATRANVPEALRYWNKEKESERKSLRDELVAGRFAKDEGRHRSDRCMSCAKAPEIEILWAEGMGHAWFCKKCLMIWCKEHPGEVDSAKEVRNGKAASKFGDNPNPNIAKQLGISQDSSPWGTQSDKEVFPIPFILQVQTWRGPHVIRWGPSRREYHLLVKDKYDWVHPEDLTEVKDTTIFQSPFSQERWEAKGDIAPGTKLNPTKDTPSNIEVIDNGTLRIIETNGERQGTLRIIEANGERQIIISGKKVKGTYSMKRQEKSNLWSFVKS